MEPNWAASSPTFDDTLNYDRDGNWKPKYQKGEIVILETFDPSYGKVRLPAVIRYAYSQAWHDEAGYDVHEGSYEVNVIVAFGPYAAGPQDLKWWTVNETEIACSCGMSHVEYADRVLEERVSGQLQLLPDDNTKEVRSLGRIIQSR